MHELRLAAWICFVNMSPCGYAVEKSKSKYEHTLKPWTNKFRCKRKVLYAKIPQWLFSPIYVNFLFLKTFCPA